MAQSSQSGSVPKTASTPASAAVVTSAIIAAAPPSKQVVVADQLQRLQPALDEINRHTGLQLVLATATYTPIAYPKWVYKGSLSILVNDVASETAANAQGYS